MKTRRPDNTTQRDPLAAIVESLDLTGTVFLKADFTAPWAITAHVTEEDCRPFMPLPRQVLAYHYVRRGQAIVSLGKTGGDTLGCVAQQGDILLLPSNALHVLASEPGATPVSGDDLLLPAGNDGLARIVHGGGGEATSILCGFMASGSGRLPLLDALPELLVINIENSETQQWIEASVAMAARASSLDGASGAAIESGLCRLLLIEALRAYLAQNPEPTGWLAGMAHPRISLALAAIHANLSQPPCVEDLAREAGMSRSSFVEVFSQTMGAAPATYMLARRLETAAALLRETELSTAEIAYRVGYDAPEAFSRAFKRATGHSPSAWRRSA
ncbi:MAG: AraC family transcriptional regulator [Pseudomonadota bacterium]